MTDTIDVQANQTKKKKFVNKINNLWNLIWSNKKYPFMILFILFFITLAVVMIYPMGYYTIMNYNTDDIIQYYAYIDGFFYKIKSGNLSLYDTSLFGGSSFFSGVYYIPLDIFLGYAFILSYLIPTEVAYLLSNLLRIVSGALILYYVFVRKKYNLKVAFVISLIFFFTGITQTELVFPVFLGVCFYAPLAMLLVDLYLDKVKGTSFLLVLYGFSIILYDFYIAYMLFAFLAVYFVVESSIRFKWFFINKEFYKKFGLFICLIIISLLLSLFFLLPSAFYVINESSRANQSAEASMWVYSVKKNDEINISIKHYFQQWCNLFIANNPFNLCLVQPGDYIREHATLYATSGALIYFIYFLFIFKRKENILKFWVILFNILFCIPLFAMIFTFNEWAYVRWFFIPYMINLYAIAMGMNYNNFKVGTKNFLKIFPFIFLAGGLLTLLYVIIKKPFDIYFHYHNKTADVYIETQYFYPILICGIILISIYLLIILITFLFQAIKKYKLMHYSYKLIPFFIFVECIISAVIIFSSIGSTSFIWENKEIYRDVELLKNELINYNAKDGYRINVYTSRGRSVTNVNTLIGGANPNTFFQSFYNTPLNSFARDIWASNDTDWSRSYQFGYSILEAPMFNMKYIITENDCEEVVLDDYFYNKFYSEEYNRDYYVAKDWLDPFMVYDEVFYFNKNDSRRDFFKDLALLKYGYIDIDYKDDEKNKTDLENIENLKNKGIRFNNSSNVFTEMQQTTGFIQKNIYEKTDRYNKEYYEYDVSSESFDELFTKDMIYISSGSSTLTAKANRHFYFTVGGKDTDNGRIFDKLTPTHYNIYYTSANKIVHSTDDLEFRPTELLINVGTDSPMSALVLYGFNNDFVDKFTNLQNKYNNKQFKLDGNVMTISYENEEAYDYPTIIKTAYTYSKDWKIKTDGYETMNINGGFLGIIVPKDTKNVDIKLVYEPAYFNLGKTISTTTLVGFTFTYLAYSLYINIHRREELF